MLKKDYKSMLKISGEDSKIQWKHLIDFYLTNSETFYQPLKAISSNKILTGLVTKSKNIHSSLENENQKNPKDFIVYQAE